MIQSEFPEFDPEIAKEYGSSVSPSFDVLGAPLFSAEDMIQLGIRFAFNMLICWIIIRYFYYRKSKRKDFLFTFTLFSVTIFLLIYLLNSARIQVGMALGLFAIFGIIRYRTEQVSIREMTYLFAIIGLSVINGLATGVSYAELLVTNMIFIAAIAIMESSRIFKQTACKIVTYEKIDLIRPDRKAELIEDLENRTGLKIMRTEIGQIDFLRDTAFVKIYYRPEENETSTIESVTKLDRFN